MYFVGRHEWLRPFNAIALEFFAGDVLYSVCVSNSKQMTLRMYIRGGEPNFATGQFPN